MRGPACYTNSSPAEAEVTINAPVYQIDGATFGFRNEAFEYADLVLAGAGVDWLARFELAYPPTDPDSVDVRLGGTANQRPLIGGLDKDFSVDGKNVYLYFAPAVGDVVYVRYAAGVGDDGTSPDGTVPVGTMSTRALKDGEAVDDPSAVDVGYCLADGYCRYSIAQYPELYAFAAAHGLLAEGSLATGATYVVPVDPDTTFVLKYLIPYSYGEQGLDDAGLLSPPRSSTHRVQIKA